jgi:hypothetical protein
MIIHPLSIYTSMKHSLLLLKTFSACALLFRYPVWQKNKSVYASLLIKTLSIINPSYASLVLLLSVVNNFQLITSFSFINLVVIIVCIAYESSVINLIWIQKHRCLISVLIILYWLLNKLVWIRINQLSESVNRWQHGSKKWFEAYI